MYYTAKVKESRETESGTIKTKTVSFLVWDEVVSGVQVQITNEYKGSTFDWELVSVSLTPYEKVLEPTDRADGTRA